MTDQSLDLKNLIVEFVVPHYFSTLLDWEEGLGAVVHWRGEGQTIGDIYRVDGRDDLIEVRETLGGKVLTRGYIESIERIVVL